MLKIEPVWVEEALNLAEEYQQEEGNTNSWGGNLVRAAKRVAALHKTMPGPILWALGEKSANRGKKRGE